MLFDYKRKEIEQKLSSESQKHNNEIFQEMINQHEQKTRKMKEKFDRQINKLDKHLEWRIIKRNALKCQKRQKKALGQCEKSPSEETNDTPERIMFKKKAISSPV